MSAIRLVRHGQASFGAAEYDRLTDLGVRQAQALGQSLRGRIAHLDRVVSGTKRRHLDTATACLVALGIKAEITEDPAFDEFDHQDVLARLDARWADPAAIRAQMATQADPLAAFDRLFRTAMERWVGAGEDAGYRESYAGFRARCRLGLDRLAATLPRGTEALVFTSGGPVAVLAAGLLGVPDAIALDLRFGLINAAVTKIVVSGRGLRLASLNEHGHLESDGGRRITYR